MNDGMRPELKVWFPVFRVTTKYLSINAIHKFRTNIDTSLNEQTYIKRREKSERE